MNWTVLSIIRTSEIFTMQMCIIIKNHVYFDGVLIVLLLNTAF